MSREDFNAWVEHTAIQEDFTIELLRVTKKEAKTQRIEELRENLNRQ